MLLLLLLLLSLWQLLLLPFFVGLLSAIAVCRADGSSLAEV